MSEVNIETIPRGWDVKSFKDVLKIKGRIGWKGYTTHDLRDSGPLVIGGTNIKSRFYLDYSANTYLSREKYLESPEIMVKQGDVLLVTRGNGIGDVGYYDGKYSEATINPSVVILSEFVGCSKYLTYYLLSPQGQNELLAHEGGSSIPALYQGSLKEVKCIIPPLQEQQRIAEVLSSLDDKIDLLHRQNQTLEQLAETLFRQWFVEEADDNCEEGKVSDICKLLSGYAFKSSSFISHGNYRIITIKNVQDGYLDLSSTSFVDKIPSNLPQYCRLSKGNILLSLTGNVGRVCRVTEDNLLLNQRVALISPVSDVYYEFCLTLFSSDNTRLLLEELSKGTAQANLSSVETMNMTLMIPKSQWIHNYHQKTKDLYEKQINNQIQIQNLSAMRDTLLPKLMSGAVRVS